MRARRELGVTDGCGGTEHVGVLFVDVGDDTRDLAAEGPRAASEEVATEPATAGLWRAKADSSSPRTTRAIVREYRVPVRSVVFSLWNTMPVRKIAISVAEDVLAEVDRAAAARRTTRSGFITEVLRRVATAGTEADLRRRIQTFFEDPAVQREQRRDARRASRTAARLPGWEW